MSPSDIPESLLAVFDLPGEEEISTRPAPTKEPPKFHDEKLSYAFATPAMGGEYASNRPEADCWANATNEGIEKPMIYDSLKKPNKFTEFDFKDF